MSPKKPNAPVKSTHEDVATRRIVRKNPNVAAAAVGLAVALAIGATVPAAAIDLDELTVVTLARDGSWGVGTAGSQGPAIAAAIRDCQAMATAPNDCGAQFATTRGSWVVARLCGDHKIMVTAETREAADQAALTREMALRRLHACTRVLTVNPRGVVVPSQSAPPQQIGARRDRGFIGAD